MKKSYAVQRGGQINLYGNSLIKFARKEKEERKKERRKRKNWKNADFAQKMWIKIRFKFESREKFYVGFPCQKKSMWILFKMNPDKIEGNASLKFSAWALDEVISL